MKQREKTLAKHKEYGTFDLFNLYEIWGEKSTQVYGNVDGMWRVQSQTLEVLWLHFTLVWDWLLSLVSASSSQVHKCVCVCACMNTCAHLCGEDGRNIDSTVFISMYLWG